MSTIAEYLESLRGKSVAVIGMGVSNTPLIRMMLRAGLKVTVCDKSPRERVEELADELESLGASFQLVQGIQFEDPELLVRVNVPYDADMDEIIATAASPLILAFCPARNSSTAQSTVTGSTTSILSVSPATDAAAITPNAKCESPSPKNENRFNTNTTPISAAHNATITPTANAYRTNG